MSEMICQTNLRKEVESMWNRASAKKLLAAGSLVLGALMISSPANATFVFSDVSYTDNSLTFTIDGDMTGYAAPSSGIQFSLKFLGDIWAGPADGYQPNSWSTSVFDDRSISSNGNLYNNAGTTPYAWSWYSTDLFGATATSRTVTVSWSQSWLNAAALTPTIEFLWGNGYGSGAGYTVLASVDMNSATQLVAADPSAVPEPGTLAVFGLGLAGLGFLRRRRKS